jgi:transcriptional regulator with XRE-family HTH domain
MEDLPAAVRAVRQALGMRQADLAEALKVKRNTISQYETGDATPSFLVLTRLYNVAPPDWKSAFRDRLVSDFRADYPEHPELAEAVVQDLSSSETILHQFPKTKNMRRGSQLQRLASVIYRISQKPMLDPSINDILDDWFLQGDSTTAKVFREAAEYIEVRLEILAGGDPEEPDHADVMRAAAKAARRLAIALLRQADIAEEKARQAGRRRRRAKPA